LPGAGAAGRQLTGIWYRRSVTATEARSVGAGGRAANLALALSLVLSGVILARKSGPVVGRGGIRYPCTKSSTSRWIWNPQLAPFTPAPANHSGPGPSLQIASITLRSASPWQSLASFSWRLVFTGYSKQFAGLAVRCNEVFSRVAEPPKIYFGSIAGV
jgi:hypothetical protein